MKSQDIRLLDVFVIGPLLIWAGMKIPDPLMRGIVMGIGGATIGYNYATWERGNNYTPHLHTAECPTGFITQGDCNQ